MMINELQKSKFVKLDRRYNAYPLFSYSLRVPWCEQDKYKKLCDRLFGIGSSYLLYKRGFKRMTTNYVYCHQKDYVEFFLTKDQVSMLLLAV